MIDNRINKEYEKLFKDRMIMGHFGSKSRYQDSHPNDEVVFNARICIEEDGLLVPIYYADINLNLYNNKLVEISKEINKTIYVMYESAGWTKNKLSDFTEGERIFKIEV